MTTIYIVIVSMAFINIEVVSLLLYKSLIKPHLEYAIVIWYPKYKYQSLLKECKEEQLNY